MAIPAPPEFLSTVRSFAREHDILRPGPLVLAVSGGTDSTALCFILAELRDEFGLVLHVAHFDHRTRPRAAPRDAAFVADLANRIGATLRLGRADRAPKNEEEARTERYAFLRRVAREIGATAIATGHTRDDQAETVLLHLVRGSGIAGLAGMRPERDGIVRPLLRIGRDATAAVCRAARIAPRDDPTNRSLRHARNRIRHRVLPELARLNPAASEAIARLADAAADLAEATRADAERVLETASHGDDIALELLPSDPAARESALALWWERLAGRRLTARHRAALADLASTDRGSRSLDLPGGRALREYAVLRRAEAVDAPRSNGTTRLARGRAIAWGDWRIALDVPDEATGAIAMLTIEDAEALVVRARRPGDRLAGRSAAKVQDVFTDAKVPARLRDGWPLVTIRDRVIWVPGLTPAPRGGTVRLAVTGPMNSKSGHAGNREQVASLVEVRPVGGKRGRRRT